MTNHERTIALSLALRDLPEADNVIDCLISECIKAEMNADIYSLMSFTESTITDAECQEEAEVSPFDDTIESIKKEHQKNSEEYSKKFQEYWEKKNSIIRILEKEKEVFQRYEKERKKYQHLLY